MAFTTRDPDEHTNFSTRNLDKPPKFKMSCMYIYMYMYPKVTFYYGGASYSGPSHQRTTSV